MNDFVAEDTYEMSTDILPPRPPTSDVKESSISSLDASTSTAPEEALTSTAPEDTSTSTAGEEGLLLSAAPVAASTPLREAPAIRRRKTAPTGQRAHLYNAMRAIIRKNHRLKQSNKQKTRKIHTMKQIDRQWEETVQEVEKRVSPQFHRLFLSETRNFGKNSKGKRWSFDEKMLAMAMHCRGPRLYNYMRRFLSLPSPRTLKNVFNEANIPPGVNSTVKRILTKKVSKMPEPHKEVIVIADEVSLEKGITYCKRKDAMVGFQDLGPLGKKKKPASHAFQFVVKSIYAPLKYPIAYYATGEDLTAADIAKLQTQVISDMQSTGLRVRGIVTDGPPKNRKAYKILGANDDQPYSIVNEQKIYTFIDPPSSSAQSGAKLHALPYLPLQRE